MEGSKLISIVGLSLNIIGFILILIYGFPTKYIDDRYKRESPENIFKGRNISREIYHGYRDKYNQRIKHKGIFGIVLIIIGLMMQIWGNFS